MTDHLAPIRADDPVSPAEEAVVELWHVPGCPNGTAYLPHLQRLLTEAGVRAAVRTRLVTGPEQAHRERFLGSPTVRVDGVDVDPGAQGRAEFALSCRLYATATGLRPTPPDEWILAALHARPDPD